MRMISLPDVLSGTVVTVWILNHWSLPKIFVCSKVFSNIDSFVCRSQFTVYENVRLPIFLIVIMFSDLSIDLLLSIDEICS